jgi:hypothetical protein
MCSSQLPPEHAGRKRLAPDARNVDRGPASFALGGLCGHRQPGLNFDIQAL